MSDTHLHSLNLLTFDTSRLTTDYIRVVQDDFLREAERLRMFEIYTDEYFQRGLLLFTDALMNIVNTHGLSTVGKEGDFIEYSQLYHIEGKVKWDSLFDDYGFQGLQIMAFFSILLTRNLHGVVISTESGRYKYLSERVTIKTEPAKAFYDKKFAEPKSHFLDSLLTILKK